MFDLTYTAESLFAAVRITLWFLLLFGGIAPLFLDHTKKLPVIEKLIYSWVGLGGVIIVSVYLLTVFHIYDFISIVVTLLLIPLVRNIWKSREEGILEYFRSVELRTIVSHVKFIERSEGVSRKGLWKLVKEKLFEWKEGSGQAILALIIATAGGLTRMIPAIVNPSPFSRSWYTHLDRIKNLRLQDYFGELPEPGGMHSLVSIFSMFTQVSPEMILHLLGALSSFFLCILIFWTTKDITRNRYPAAPILAMSIYALAPMLFLPLSLDQQIEANALDLSLCFAIPTITIFIRNLRGSYKSPWFYVLSGFVATAMTDLFVAFVIVLPSMLIGLLALPRRNYLRSLFRVLGYIGSITLLVLTPYVLFCYLNGLEIFTFFRGQFFDTGVYSFNPMLLMDLGDLSMIYAGAALVLLLLLLIIIAVKRKLLLKDELVFLLVFLVVSSFYLPFLDYGYVLMDPDQLNGFYALLICVFAGVLFTFILRAAEWLNKGAEQGVNRLSQGLLILAIGSVLYLQGGIHISRMLPSTLPNGFFKAYYDLIDERLPYSYATVGPEIDRTLAKNRHYFMNYNYFMNEYGSVDSLYHQWLLVPESDKKPKTIPPASIFVFVENPPYGSIQQGILYNSAAVMRDLRQWLRNFRKLENRELQVFYSSPDVTVYEIVNRDQDSQVNAILSHTESNSNSD